MIYLVHGQDEYLVKKNIENLIKKNIEGKNYDLSNYSLHEDTVNTIITEIQNDDLFSENKVFVISDDNNLWQKYMKNEKFLSLLMKHSKKTMVIIKILKNDIKLNVNNHDFVILKIKNYNKKQLALLVNKVCTKFNINISDEAKIFLIDTLPSDVNIFLNELSKLRAINDSEISLEIIKDIVPTYNQNNLFKIVDFILKKDYQNFWINFNYINNYDKINVINILAYQLHLLRDIKILINQNKNYQFIAKHLNISSFQVKNLAEYMFNVVNINNILLKLCQLDYKIKVGKCNKNVAIDIFFLSI